MNATSSYPFHRHYFHDDPFMEDIPFSAKTIRLLKTKPEDLFVYDAAEIRSSLKRKYEIE